MIAVREREHIPDAMDEAELHGILQATGVTSAEWSAFHDILTPLVSKMGTGALARILRSTAVRLVFFGNKDAAN